MKRFILIIYSLFLILPIFARDIGTKSTHPLRYRVISQKVLNVRNAPSTNSKVLFTVSPGDYIYGEAYPNYNSNWVKITGAEWYVNKDYLAEETNPHFAQVVVQQEDDTQYSTTKVLKIQKIVRWSLLIICIIIFIIGFFIIGYNFLFDFFNNSTNHYIKDASGKELILKQKFYYGIESYIGVITIVGLIVLSILAGILTVLFVGGVVWLLLAIVWVLLWGLIILGWIGLVGGGLALFFGGKEDGAGIGCTGIILGGVIVGFSDEIEDFGDRALDAGFTFFENLYIVDFARDLVLLYWKPALMIAAAPLAIFLALVIINIIISGILMLIEYIVMLRYNIKNPCPVCQHASEPAIYLSYGLELPVRLHPGKYGLFHITHPITNESMPTMLLNGKDKLERKCNHCNNIISANMGTEKHIALAGVAESGKTTLVYRLIAELMLKFPDKVNFTDIIQVEQTDPELIPYIEDIIKDGYLKNFPNKTSTGQRRAIQLKIDRGLNMFYRLFINDVGGELYDIKSMSSEESALTAQFVRNVESILFIVDPMTIDFSECDTSEEFKVWLNKNISHNLKINIFEAFSRLKEFFESQNISKRDISRININIVLVKSDMGYLSQIDTTDQNAIRGFMESDMGLSRLISDITSVFSAEHIKYITFSAIGKNEKESHANMLANTILEQLSIKDVISDTIRARAKNLAIENIERERKIAHERATRIKEAKGSSITEPNTTNNVLNKGSEILKPVVVTESKGSKDLYNVILTDPGEAKLSLIKLVKELVGLSLGDAKALVDNTPSVIVRNVSKAEADNTLATIDSYGGKGKIVPADATTNNQ